MFKKTIFAVAVLCASASLADDWSIPLSCPNDSEVAGWRPITVGVPLLPGQAKQTSELVVAIKDANGNLTAIPAQFRVLARWWRANMIPGSPGDDSIRWVLVDTAVNIQPKQKVELLLTSSVLPRGDLLRAQTQAKGQATVSAEATDDAITIDTGAARFTINRKKFNLLDQVSIAGGDVLKSSNETGGVIEDTYGNKYYMSSGTRSVELVDTGPLRVQVRARGSFIDPTGKGYSKGMYRYDVLLNFYAGQSAVYVDYVIVNNAGKSIGSPTFEGASVVLKLAGETGANTATFMPNAGAGPASAQAHKMAVNESICLYQDSNGGDAWDATPGVGHMHSSGYTYPKGAITSFKGYRIYKRTTDAQRAATQPDDGGEVVGQGTRARGLAVAEAAPGGGGPRLSVFVPRFWQLFPKAIEVGADGTVRIGILPRETKVYHYLEDTAGCGTEFVLDFISSTMPTGLLAQRTVATWDHRLMPRPPIEHIARCGALADLGPYTVPTQGLDRRPDTRVHLYSDRSFTNEKLYGNAFGWASFGERWRSNGGHGRRGARQPISEDDYLYRWYVTGVPQWFDVGDARSRHFRDIRVYQIDVNEQDPFSFPDWNAFRAANRNEDWTNRPQPKDEEYLKYTQGRYSRSDWPFPNPEHTTIDLLYDRYLLFGDVRCLENMRIGAAHGGYFSGRGSPMGPTWPWRANGWGMRALFRYWDLTGDKLADGCLRDVIKTHAAHIGKENFHSVHDPKKPDINWWFTNVYARAAAKIALHTADPQMLELCKTLAKGKEGRAGSIPTVFAVLYHMTGEESYRKAVLGDGSGEKMLNVGGYFPACDHWLLHQPPRKK